MALPKDIIGGEVVGPTSGCRVGTYITPCMNRRSFLATTGAGVLAISNLTGGSLYQGGQAMTVLGSIMPAQLGRTLVHEHIMVDFIGADAIRPGRYYPEDVFQKALPHLRQVKSAGCKTLVDCTPAYIGRDAGLLRRLSQASGLQIVTNTGLYGAAHDKYVPKFAYAETVQQLAARWVKEFEDGIESSGVRPGIIKIGVDSGPLSEIDAKLVKAAAIAHQQTGLTIASHTGDGVAAMAQISILKSHGVAPEGLVWVHAQNETDTKLHLRAADAGAWVEFDGISSATAEKHLELVLRMKRAGYLRRVLLSQDSGWYHVGEPGGGDFHPYDFLFTEFLPLLGRRGVSEAEIETLMVHNPRAVLTRLRHSQD
jgi:predicted metal-dependent phosphotriesterase family hydrolase